MTLYFTFVKHFHANKYKILMLCLITKCVLRILFFDLKGLQQLLEEKLEEEGAMLMVQAEMRNSLMILMLSTLEAAAPCL